MNGLSKNFSCQTSELIVDSHTIRESTRKLFPSGVRNDKLKLKYGNRRVPAV